MRIFVFLQLLCKSKNYINLDKTLKQQQRASGAQAVSGGGPRTATPQEVQRGKQHVETEGLDFILKTLAPSKPNTQMDIIVFPQSTLYPNLL